MTSGIYCITCVATGARYVGLSTQLQKRWRTQQQQIVGRKHENPNFLSLYEQHGIESFTFEVLEECPSSFSESHLQAVERKWIERMKPSLNRRLPYDRELNRQRSEQMKSWWAKRKAEYKMQGVQDARRVTPHDQSIHIRRPT
jgi:group I intron endonuclease